VERLEVIQGDITKLQVDAIVNAANRSLLGGGGLDGAIHRAAGPQLIEECRKLNGCPTGEARITKGYNLPARFVIHTVGPVWHGGYNNEDELLASCYKNSLKLASENNCHTIAFPNISTGIYGFPKDRGASIAVNLVKEYIDKNPLPEKVIFVTFGNDNYEIYSRLLNHPEN
jgi:O-acetyl-ADP-ribose deacetylase